MDSAAENLAPQTQAKQLICGVIMPISAIDGCSSDHWIDVKSIIFGAISSAGFEPNLVSDADEVGVIQKRIIQNLYDNPVCVCDVSGKNPNVMFELGLRLAFDKPTIIVKDDKTDYSFDTAQIEHLTYPRDLRFQKINTFAALLAQKIKSTHVQATENSAYTTFLKHFGEFTVAKIEKKEVSGQEYIINRFDVLSDQVLQLQSMVGNLWSRQLRSPSVGIRDVSSKAIDKYAHAVAEGKSDRDSLIGVAALAINRSQALSSVVDKIAGIPGVYYIKTSEAGGKTIVSVFGVDKSGAVEKEFERITGESLLPF